MAANPSSANQITYEITFQASQALDALRQLNGEGKNFDELAVAMQAKIDEVAKKMGVDWELVLAILKQVNAEAAKTGQGIITPINDSKEAMNVANTAATNLFSTVKNGFQSSGEKATDFVNVMNLVKMAIGEIYAIVVFQLYQALINIWTDSLKNAQDYYQALQNITIAQQAMAQQGISVTNQELLSIVDQLSQKWTIFSNVQMTQAVSQAALLGAQYGLSVQQVQKLADMAATLAAEHGGMPADYVDNLIKAAQGTNSLWANQQGIAITSADILAKAKELGLVTQDTKKIEDERVKAVSGLAVEYDRLATQSERAQQNQNSFLGVGQQVAAESANALTQLGKQLTLLEDGLKAVGAGLSIGLLSAITLFESRAITAVSQVIAAFLLLQGVLKGNISLLDANTRTLEQMATTVSEKLQTAFAQFLNQGGINMSNAPTAPAGAGGSTELPVPDESKLQSILNSVAKDYQSYYDSVERATEEYNNRMQDLQDQYNLRVQQEEENTALRISQEKQNFHLRVLQEEENYQQKMRELTARYEMDLEDALRKRDAEAVIKLIERYNNEKTTAQQQEQLRIQQMKQEENLRIKQMKEEEQLRLKQMQEEFQLQQAQATRNYNEQLAQLKQSLDEKLQEEAVKAGQELNLNQGGIDKIYALFQQYYGSNGLFAQTQQSSYIKMIEQSQTFVNDMIAIFQGYAAAMTAAMSGMGYTSEGHLATSVPTEPVGSGGGGGGGSSKRYAAGGYALAQSATTVTFGEAGPELATFIPLNSAGSASPVSGGLSGLIGQGGGGLARIAVELGPDLVARIVNTTLTHAAISIEQVYGRS